MGTRRNAHRIRDQINDLVQGLFMRFMVNNMIVVGLALVGMSSKHGPPLAAAAMIAMCQGRHRLEDKCKE